MTVHPLLERQLKRHLAGQPLDAFKAFLDAVDAAYVAAEEERLHLEYTIELSSTELRERYDQLQRDTADRLRVTRERDNFFRVSTDLLCIVTPDLRFSHVNPRWQTLLGFSPEQMCGTAFMNYVHPDDVEKTVREASDMRVSGRSTGFENRYRTADGQFLALAWTAVTDPDNGFIYAVARDITEQRKLEANLAQAQKLEAVGQLASGVAHEINTPVQFIGDNVQFVVDGFAEIAGVFASLQRLLAADPPKRSDLQALREACAGADLDYLTVEIPKSLAEAKEGARRVAELVKALKEFAHVDEPEFAAADLNGALERTLVLARGEVKHIAELRTSFSDLPAIDCHIGSLNQVFLNMIINAAHAIEDKNKKLGLVGEGVIEVSTRLDGDHVVVAIRDTGCGLTDAVQKRLFEPFFTTKEVGRGSGQGMPLVRKVVVDRHHGDVRWDTTVDVGTTFFISLPLRHAQPGATEVRPLARVAA